MTKRSVFSNNGTWNSFSVYQKWALRNKRCIRHLQNVNNRSLSLLHILNSNQIGQSLLSSLRGPGFISPRPSESAGSVWKVLCYYTYSFSSWLCSICGRRSIRCLCSTTTPWLWRCPSCGQDRWCPLPGPTPPTRRSWFSSSRRLSLTAGWLSP